jgi:N-methylhydantoinase A
MKLAFDTGGTFTDLALMGEDGRIILHKVLSTPRDPAEAVLRGIDELLALPDRPQEPVEAIFGATTVVTNAVLERRGAETALVTTDGFEDILRIRTEARYDLYDLKLQFPEPLVPRSRCFGVVERVTARGEVRVPLDEDDVASVAAALRAKKVESVAVCLLHAYRHGEHETRIRELFADLLPGVHVSLSSAVCPEVREYDRASTTVVNAYTQPLMVRHAAQLEHELAARRIDAQLLWMTSSGGLVPAATAAQLPVRMIESGPAAGVVATTEYSRRTGDANLLSFDMGGTTAKLCLVLDGTPRIGNELEVARHARFKRGSGYPLKIQSIEMVEIGAGGGSIAAPDSLGLMAVGPRSAGAAPGPACYGLGGKDSTVTDADLLLGYLDEGSFLGGSFRLDRGAAEAAMQRLAHDLGLTVGRAAWGVHDLVNENMARAAAMHAIDCGVDPRILSMVAFGGAGPTHAYGVARKLGIRRIVCPLGAGVNSAIGLLCAPVAVDVAMSAPMALSQFSATTLATIRGQLAEEAMLAIRSASVPREAIRFSYSADMRHVGQGYELNIPLPDAEPTEGAFVDALAASFRRRYRALYGRIVAGADLEVITWRLRASGPINPTGAIERPRRSSAAAPRHTRPVYFGELGDFIEAKVYDHYALEPGQAIAGPAVVEQRETTSLIGPSASATLDGDANLVIQLS